MKKIISISIVGILILSGLGAVAIQDNNETNALFKTANIQLSEPIILEENDYLTLKLVEEQTYLMSAGKPMMPQIVKTFEFPAGTEIEDVNVNINWESIDLAKKITPAPVPIPSTMPMETVTFEHEREEFDESVYSSTEMYPSEPYTIKYGSGINNGEQVIYVNVRCYSQYSPANDVVKVPDTINIDINYNEPETPLFTADEYDLLIITDEVFEDSLQDLVDHKNSIGIKTKMVTTDEIYPAYDGVADWEDIKLYLADVVLDWGVEYVLLAGGRKGQTHEWYIPEFLSNNFDGAYAGSGIAYDIVYGCDLYYADLYYPDQYGHLLMDDWDSNGNGIYAEGPYYNSMDIPDYYPDVYLGRIPLRYSWEADIAVDKIIEYENNANPSWFKKCVLCGGDTTPPARYESATPGVYEGELACDVTGNYMESIGFEVTKLYTSENGDMQVTSGPEDVYPTVSDGCGWVNMQCHANPAVGGNFLPDAPTEEEFAYFYTIFDIRYFQNDGKYPFMVIDGCHNGQFNVSMQQIFDAGGLDFPRAHFLEFSPTDGTSWFLLQEGGGAIGGVGNTALGYGYVNTGITQGLGGWISPRFAHAYAIQGKETTGELYSQAITDYIDNFPINADEVDRKTMEERPLFGDPSIKLGGTGGAMSSPEPEDYEEPEQTNEKLLAPIEAPVWQKGDSWKYKLDDFSFAMSEIEDRAGDFELSSDDITFEVVDVTASEYRVSISADNVDVTAAILFNPYTGNDAINIPKVTLENVTLGGMITVDKDTIAFEKVELLLTVDLIENIDNLLPFLGIELPPIVEKLLPFMEIPANIEVTIDFDPAFKLVEFPIEEGSNWGLDGGEITITIDGSVESIWLRILNFVNRFIEIVPPEFAQYLPDVDISEVLTDFGVPTEMTFELPVIHKLFRKPIFEFVGMTTVGSYNAARIKVVHGVLDMYYSPEAKMFAKISGPFDEFLPFTTNLNLELIG